MNVAKYIAELLHHYECVVVPGLGGFIVNDRPATVNRINHQFKPPFRKILFNVHLKANDGLLVNKMSASKNISYQEARLELDQFVNFVIDTLNKDESYNFEHIGNIRFDKERNVVFEQDNKINYNPESYGLIGFVSSPVKRTTDEERLRSIIAPKKSEPAKPIDRKPKVFIAKKKERRSRKPLVIVAFVLILLMGIGWGIYNPDQIKYYWQYTAGLIPDITKITHSGNENNVINEARYIPRKLVESDEVILAKIKALDKTSDESEKIAEEKVTEKPVTNTDVIKPVDKIEQQPPKIEKTGPLYYIIAGSFSDIENANRLVDNLRIKGYHARIADTNDNGMFRVAYTGIESLQAAKQKLYAIRQDDNSEAWIFRK